jgi:hypothetical protein
MKFYQVHIREAGGIKFKSIAKAPSKNRIISHYNVGRRLVINEIRLSEKGKKLTQSMIAHKPLDELEAELANIINNSLPEIRGINPAEYERAVSAAFLAKMRGICEI